MSFGRPQTAVLSSSLILLVAVLLFIPLYQRMLLDSSPPEAVKDLEYGKHGYLLLNSERSGCMGWLRYELDYDGSYSFLFDAFLRYSLGAAQEIGNGRVSAGAAFNSLNQLTGIYVRMQVNDKEYKLELEGVTDIVVTLEGEFGGVKQQMKSSIRGPIEIYEPQEGKFLIRSQAFPTLEQISQTLQMNKPIETTLPVEFLEVFSSPVDTSHSASKTQEEMALHTQCLELAQVSFELDRVFEGAKKVAAMVVK